MARVSTDWPGFVVGPFSCFGRDIAINVITRMHGF